MCLSAKVGLQKREEKQEVLRLPPSYSPSFRVGTLPTADLTRQAHTASPIRFVYRPRTLHRPRRFPTSEVPNPKPDAIPKLSSALATGGQYSTVTVSTEEVLRLVRSLSIVQGETVPAAHLKGRDDPVCLSNIVHWPDLPCHLSDRCLGLAFLGVD